MEYGRYANIRPYNLRREKGETLDLLVSVDLVKLSLRTVELGLGALLDQDLGHGLDHDIVVSNYVRHNAEPGGQVIDAGGGCLQRPPSHVREQILAHNPPECPPRSTRAKLTAGSHWSHLEDISIKPLLVARSRLVPSPKGKEKAKLKKKVKKLLNL